MACWGKDSMDEQNQHVYVTWLRDQLRIPVSIRCSLCPKLKHTTYLLD